MDKRLGSRALDELEKMPPYPKPEEVEYRQYDIGLVYEAMSYDAKTCGRCIRMDDLFTRVQDEVSRVVMERLGAQQRPVMAKSGAAAEIVLGARVQGAAESCFG
jgi:hypothetical protein